jgi:hypothetical protein
MNMVNLGNLYTTAGITCRELTAWVLLECPNFLSWRGAATARTMDVTTAIPKLVLITAF